MVKHWFLELLLIVVKDYYICFINIRIIRLFGIIYSYIGNILQINNHLCY